MPKNLQDKFLVLAIGLFTILACSQIKGPSQWIQAPNHVPKKPIRGTVRWSASGQSDYKCLDLKQFPQHVFGRCIIPYLRGSDIHNLILTAKSLRCTVWTELPFFFKEGQRRQQLEHYLENPRCLTSIAVMSLREYISENYPLAVEQGSIALPSLPAKRLKINDTMAIRSDLFIRFLARIGHTTTSIDSRLFCSVSAAFHYHPLPDPLIYSKARLLSPIYDYLSLPTILNALQIPDDYQACDDVQSEIYADFSILAALKNIHASDTQRQSAQQLLQAVLAAGGRDWVSEFNFVEVASCYGNIFLAYEAAYGCTKASQQLILCGASVNGGDYSEETPLHYATRYGHLNTIKFLLENHARVNQPNCWGKTVLFSAISKHPDVMNILLAYGADVNTQNRAGQTPLHSAIFFKCSNVMNTLLAHGADINAQDASGQTPLHLAILCYPEILDSFLAYGPDINAQDGLGRTPLQLVVLHHPKGLNALLAHGADVNLQDRSGQVPLHLATLFRPEVSNTLLAHGADIGARDRTGQTPLHLATLCCPEVLNNLLAHGANVNARDEMGLTPLHCACSKNYPETVHSLLGQGANTHQKNTNGDSVLHTAAFTNTLNIVRLLIKHGADINARNYCGSTPLHQIAGAVDHRPCREMIHLLLANGADTDVQNNCWETPLMIALSSKNLKAIELLIACGAKTNVSHPINGTALQWARCNLAEAQASIWSDIMGNPPYNNERVKYLYFLAKLSGIESFFQEPFYSLTPQRGKNASRLAHPVYQRLVMSPPLISPKDTFLVLSKHSHAHIQKVFGNEVLKKMKQASLDQRIMQLLQKRGKSLLESN